ncbi:hypothetical protein V8E53_012276 [Lactarius tabidus]
MVPILDFQEIENPCPWFSRQILVGLTFVEAVILILKHTTSLWISNEELKSTLTLAEVDYQKANINLKIQEYLQASPEHSVEESAHFIMATDIALSQPLIVEEGH